MHFNGNLALGKFGIISGQYDKAVNRLEKVLSLQPENAEALFLSGEAYSNLGLNEKAISCFSKCKEIVENEDLKKEIDAYLQQLL
jgi:tetratricopeptide (TPR) repeat protein